MATTTHTHKRIRISYPRPPGRATKLTLIVTLACIHESVKNRPSPPRLQDLPDLFTQVSPPVLYQAGCLSVGAPKGIRILIVLVTIGTWATNPERDPGQRTSVKPGALHTSFEKVVQLGMGHTPLDTPLEHTFQNHGASPFRVTRHHATRPGRDRSLRVTLAEATRQRACPSKS